MNAFTLNSNLLGYNNQSGLNYTTKNGMRQYEGNTPIYPTWHLPRPMYEGKQNIKLSLGFLRNKEKDGNQVVDGQLEELPMGDQEIFGRGLIDMKNLSQQTQPERMLLDTKVKKLASQNISKLPANQTRDDPTNTKFNKFLARQNTKETFITKAPPLPHRQRRRARNFRVNAIKVDTSELDKPMT